MTTTSGDFLVRQGNTWYLTHLPGIEPTTLDDAGVRKLLGQRPATGPEDADGMATATVTPAWCWSARVLDERLIVEGLHGDEVQLDATDVAVLGDVNGPTEASALSERHGAAANGALKRLLKAGAITRLDPAPQHQEVRHVDSGTRRWWRRRPRRAVSVGPTRVRNTSALHPADPPSTGRVPVYAPWFREFGPPLSLGMLTAAARHHDGGKLVAHYEIRRPEPIDSFDADQAERRGPGVLLLSCYVWSLDANLDLARRARARNPELFVVLGGPSVPKYPADTDLFLQRHHDAVDVLVRGEGEHVLCEILELLRPKCMGGPLRFDPGTLRQIPGVAFLEERGQVISGPDPVRIADLDSLPSPYLSGEFDHITPNEWRFLLAIETNRGCPYGCTFCDWGSSTQSRIRKFDLDRVRAEIAWAGENDAPSIMLTDANFGILSRDVEIAAAVAETRRRTGNPEHLALTPAKNTIRHLVEITSTLVDSGVVPTICISLQTTDAHVLKLIDRENISIDAYLELAADFRRHGLPLVGDFLLGLPGQTVGSFSSDLQFSFDHEILPRTWHTALLPNAPMNAPDYRERHGIRCDDKGLVVETSSFDPVDRLRMMGLRRAYVIFDCFGVARHFARWLQWDHGIMALSLFERAMDVTERQPSRFPHLTWLMGYFDLFPCPPAGWGPLYEELAALVQEEFGVEIDGAARTVIAVQHHLMPRPGRVFPSSIELEFDYIEYQRSALAGLYTDGRARGPARTLSSFGPGVLTISGDPLDLCGIGPRLEGNPRDEAMEGDFHNPPEIGYELDSPLARNTHKVAAAFPEASRRAAIELYRRDIDEFQVERRSRAKGADNIATRIVGLRPRSDRRDA